MLDVIIKNGQILDGTGNPGYIADIGIIGDRIVEIGNLPNAAGARVIHATGLTVSSGFIDIHSHTDVELLVNARAESKIRQGITTEVSGNCGSTPFPYGRNGLTGTKKWLARYGLELDWSTCGEFLERLEKQGIGINYATYIGQGNIRAAVMGEDDRKPTAEEIALMQNEVAKAMEEGAFGLSTGLIYPPGSFATTEEIVELAKIAAQYGGIYSTHMRSEGKFLLEAIEEAITICKHAGIPVQIAHLKVSGNRNWGKAKFAIEKIAIARNNLLPVSADRYPYIASATGLDSLIPLWAHNGGMDALLSRLRDPETRSQIADEMLENIGEESGWEDTIISSVVTEANKPFEGKNLKEIAAMRNQDITETIFDLLIEEEGQISAIFFSMNEEETDYILSQPFVSIGTDAGAKAPYGPLSEGKPHPRAYGTFPRAIAVYCREKKLFALPELIRKMTLFNAEKIGLVERGKIQRGYYADIVVFDAAKITDTATFLDPHQFPKGIELVMVNGKIVVEKGGHTGILAGKVLRKR
ncbi:MAG: D-aminoacylase [bacterium]|nr:D-aminoacylase [bacterium]